MTPHRSRTPWVNGEPLDGVALPYNCRVQIIGGPLAGQTGWLVAVGEIGVDPLYTVELESREPDAEVRQSMLRRTA